MVRDLRGRSAVPVVVACAFLLLAGGALQATAQAGVGTWGSFVYPPTGTGCVKSAWQGDAIYMVRTPGCSMAPGQTITFERYTPANGLTEIIAQLPETAAQATVKAIGGKVYIFSPDNVLVGPQATTRVYDPAAGELQVLSSLFPGCHVDAPTMLDGLEMTWVSNCVWNCNFVHYDAATDTFALLPQQLPDPGFDLLKLGLAWDGTVAHILTYNTALAETRFYDYDPATGSLLPGALTWVPGSGPSAPLLQTGPAEWFIPVYSGGGSQMARLDLVTSSFTTEPGILTRAPVIWGGGVGWSINTLTGAISCVTPAGTCSPVLVTIDPVDLPDELPEESPAASSWSPAEASAPPMASWSTDTDTDGVADGADSCPGVPNVDQADADLDGVGDACDPRPGYSMPTRGEPVVSPPEATTSDADQDGIADAADNCPAKANRDQLDLDGDAAGDACDDDLDGDGIAQRVSLAGMAVDNCPTVPNADQRDRDRDGVGDACGPPAIAAVAAPPAIRSKPLAAEATRGDGSALWVAAAGGLAGLGLATGMSRRRWSPFALALFSRWAGRDPPQHSARQKLWQAIEAHPGIHFNELARLVDQGRGAVKHHLTMMEKAGQVRLVVDGRYTCVYLADAPRETGAGLRKSEVARRIESMVHDQPGITAAEASRTLGVSYGAAAYHMRRMAEAGLVRLEGKPLAAFPAQP